MMNCKKRFTSYCTAIGFTVAAICGGCSRGPDPNRYVPSAELAQAAVEAALVDWQAGLPRGTINRLKVKVESIDNQRKKDQKLVGFEILGEVAQPGARGFAVRLTFQKETDNATVRYVVLGIDPLFVYRQEDFDLLNQWDHMMPDETGDGSNEERSVKSEE